MVQINLAEIIVPIFGFSNAEKQWLFLGTGVFCGTPPLLVTADHVLGNMYDAVKIQVVDSKTFYRASSVRRQPSVDLALLEIENYIPRLSCQLAKDEEIVFNKPIYCYEYGTTRTLGKQIEVSPATRMGNVTRIRNLQDMYGIKGEAMLELSFPALRGASGSPILDIAQDIKVWGIVVANISYHLMPAQIETVTREDGSVDEEVKFLLPQALAVNVKHLRHFMNEIGAMS
jgi:hypothetical protein